MMPRERRPFPRAGVLVLTTMFLLTVLAGVWNVEQASAIIVVVDGDWTVTGTDNVYDGIIFKVDGNVTIESGALLEIDNGGLVFLEDSNHIYHLEIRTGGSGHGTLILDNSFLTTEPNQLSDYLKLDITVAGDLTLRNNSLIKHPGTLTTTGDAVVEIRDSRVTGFTTQEISDFTGLNPDDNDDAPVMTFQDTSSVLVVNSNISRLYENNDDPGPDSRYNITLEDSATLTVIDSYVGVDFNPNAAQHNTIAAGGTSNVYTYGMTLDESQSDLVTPDDWVPALGLQGTSQILTLTAFPTLQGEKDSTGEPLADITADDGVDYTVEDGERLYLEEFDADGQWRVVRARLTVEYWTDAGYSGTNSIQYGLEGESLTSVITVSDTGGPTTTTANATLSNVETFADARFLDISFMNNDGSGRSVHFDYMAVEVTYERIDSSATIYIHRWLDVKVVDRFGSVVPNTYVESQILPTGQLAYYPDNGGANTPGSAVLEFLGATSSDFNVTNSTGRALVPLLTEWVNSSVFNPTMPNSYFIGNYRVRTSFSSEVLNQDLSFNPYPSLDASSNRLTVTSQLGDLVWPAQDNTYVWSSTTVIDYDLELDGNVRVTGDVTIVGSQLTIVQGGNETGRHYLSIEGTGSLTIQNGGLSSNLPLVVYVTDSGQLSTWDSQLMLNTPYGRGIIYGDQSSVISIEGGNLQGDVKALGSSASLKGVTISDSNLTFDATGTSYLWDPAFDGNVGLAFLSDDGSAATLDFDIRNVTFNETLSSSVTFRGTQYAQLTNVTFLVGGDWWTGRIADNAKVGFYWWLTVLTVDGAGSSIRDANITLERLNPDTLAFELIPAPGSDDLFMGTWTGTHVEAPEAIILYRALAQERFASQGWSNSTYGANGSKVVNGETFYADINETVVMDDNSEISLVFSDLTPELSMAGLSFQGANGVSNTQPINMALEIKPDVRNEGRVEETGVTVHFYSIDVDLDDDGVMDNSPEDYTSFLLGDVNITIEPLSTSTASLSWTPTVPGTYAISVVVDQSDLRKEVNETNNIIKATLEVVDWPDLSISPSDVVVTRVPVEEGEANLQVTVRNEGTAAADDATVQLYDNGTLAGSASVDVPAGSSASATLSWIPSVAGSHNLTVLVLSKNDSFSNTDFFMDNNVAELSVDVLTKPDLEIRPSEFEDTRVVEGRTFTVEVVVYNVGSTDASNFDVGLYLDEVSAEGLLAVRVGLTIPTGSNLTLLLEAKAVSVAGNYTLIILVDTSNLIPEVREDNNRVEVTLEVVPPEGQVFIDTPQAGQSYSLGDQVLVSGKATTPAGQPIPDMKVTMVLRDPEGGFHDAKNVFTDQNGEFVAGLQIPADAPSGEWTLLVSTDVETIQGASLKVSVEKVVPWYEFTVPMVNLPLWMLLVVLAIFLVVVMAITAYMRTFGLGRLVECGECGAFIPESSHSCPKCGTEFEKEMAKCSSCHAWIPADVKKCPECGVEFTTGKAKAADYRDKMRKQYEKVVDKYRAEAARALGHKPSEKEFQEWWRRQPTYVTFQNWLKEEEEMRKMGSKPCQRCGTLNSITATICHKCGTLMSSEAPPGRRPPVGPRGTPPTGPVSKPPATPPGGTAAPVRRKKVDKPVMKKIVKKPFAKKKVPKKEK
ncbi:MAG: CARDB domain-containing protein [Thermoplasmata archaeon]